MGLRPVVEVLRGVHVPVHLGTAGLAGGDLGELRPDEPAAAAVMDLEGGRHRSARVRHTREALRDTRPKPPALPRAVRINPSEEVEATTERT